MFPGRDRPLDERGQKLELFQSLCRMKFHGGLVRARLPVRVRCSSSVFDHVEYVLAPFLSKRTPPYGRPPGALRLPDGDALPVRGGPEGFEEDPSSRRGHP